jgi:hypothetical protein
MLPHTEKSATRMADLPSAAVAGDTSALPAAQAFHRQGDLCERRESGMSKKMMILWTCAIVLLSRGEANAGNVAALWQFDGSSGPVVFDSSGNGNAGVLFNAAIDSGSQKYGPACLNLSGAGYVFVNDSLTLRPAHLTVEAWVKTLSDGFVVANSGPALKIGIELVVIGGRVRLTLGNGPAVGSTAGATQVTDGQWHHIAGTYDGATLNVYVDGNVDSSTAYTGGVGYAGDPLYIGRRQFATDPRYFTGSIDEVRIWGRALEAYEVLNSAQTGLRGLWHLDDARAHDVSGYGNHGSVSGAVTSVPGRFGQAIRFDGGVVLVPPAPSLNFRTGSFTVELWVKAVAGTVEQTVLRKQFPYADNPRDRAGWQLSMDPAHGNRWKVLLRGPGGYEPILWSNAPATTGWTHLAFTVDRGPLIPGHGIPTNNLSFYVNGVLQAAVQAPGGGVSPDSLIPPLSMGADPDGALPFHGLIDELHIWSRCLGHGELEVLAGGGPLILPEEMSAELEDGGAVFTSSWQAGMNNPVTCLLYFIPAIMGTELSEEDPLLKATPKGTTAAILDGDDSPDGQAIVFSAMRIDAKTLHVLLHLEDSTPVGMNLQWSPIRKK